MRILMSVTTWDGARVEAGLRDDGFMTTVAHDGIEIFECLDLLAHPVVLVETELAGLNWQVAVRQLRSEQPEASILVIQNGASVDNILAAFDCGADDIIDPRMQSNEIVSRILAVVARRSGFAGQVLRIGALKVDLKQRRVFWGPTRVNLSPSQYEIFERLCLNRTVSVTKDEIMGQLYGVDEGPDPRVIDVFVCKLRDRFVAAGAPSDMIETVRGRGFRLGQIDDSRGRLPLPYVSPGMPVPLDQAA